MTIAEKLKKANEGLPFGYRVFHETMTIAGKVSRRPFKFSAFGVRFPGCYEFADGARQAALKDANSDRG